MGGGVGAPGLPGGPQQPQQPQQQLMYRPEQMRRIKELTAQERIKYENGLRSLWTTFNDSAEGSAEKESAQRKIFEFAPVLARKVRERRALLLQQQQQQQQQQAQQQQDQGQQGQPIQPGQPGGQPGQLTPQQMQQMQAAQAAHAQAQAQAQAQAHAQAQAQAQAQALAQAQANGQAQLLMQQQQQQQQQQAAQMRAANASAGGAPPAGPQQQVPVGGAMGPQQQQPRPQQPVKFSENVLQALSQLTFIPPPAFNDKPPELAAKWVEDAKKKVGMSLAQMEVMRNSILKMDNAFKARSDSGQLTAEEQKGYKDRRDMMQKALEESNRFVTSFRKQQDVMQKLRQQQAAAAGGVANGQQQQQPQPQQSQLQQQQQQQPGAPTQQPTPQQQKKTLKAEPTNMQNSQANINGAIEAAKKESIAAGLRQGGANANMPINSANSISNNGGPSKPTPGPVQQTPIPPPVIPAAALQSAQKQPAKVTPVHPPPTPINTALASANKTGGPPTAGTPTSAAAAAAAAAARVQTPHSANPPNAGPRALSHQKALEEANRQRAAAMAMSTPPTGHSAQPMGSVNGGTPTGAGTPGPMSAQQTQHQMMQQHHLQQQQQAAAAAAAAGVAGQNGAGAPAVDGAVGAGRPNTKLTDYRQGSKQLSERATQLPQPVALGGGLVPGRPTLSGGSGVVGGVMGQPAVAKVPAIQIEGEGERVLNKKRLDELVRQVCGGTAEDQEGNMLQPEVEEVRVATPLIFHYVLSCCTDPPPPDCS